ncbi:MAG: TraK family protein [Candidatus Thiodiazotropha sp.]|jgi:hypothetical protein
MAKKYVEELTEWANKRNAKRPRQSMAAVAFMAARDDVKAAIDAGYAVKTIWEHMHETGNFPYRYETFLKHVRKHIKEANSEVRLKQKKVTQKNRGASQNSRKQVKKQSRADSFTFNATPKIEDLI